MADFEIAIPKTLVKEGGAKYTNIAADKGGPTKYGISQIAFPNEDIKNLEEKRARELYRINYWDICKCSQIESQAVAEIIFEAAVNMGVGVAARLAQFVAGVGVDGHIGLVTTTAINKMGEQDFICQFKLAEIARYAGICNKDRTQNKFLLGWINRVMGAA